MDIEFEATFIDIDLDIFRKKLKSVGAELINPERLMKRVVFDPPQDMAGAWLRVRDEGDKITMSIKQVTGNKIDEQKETELIIDNFEEGVKFLESIGGKKKSYQENKRESWLYREAKIEIDTWPGLESFVEVEAKSEKMVKSISEDLGLDFSKGLFGSVEIVYKIKLGIPPKVINDETPEITFENPPLQYK
ncbi:MAG: hypothetical protein COX80_03435 [Candidatus Magasanikbacteria bacterium CG_4_10_14_0_2_um_filter_33_14]|uniref:CYTH domain-containing protein n=1 Tax=Candidatus Magasanikbacteria bacterium CG_4_10_14_0_2_um_filter_33_14 TaxID=1974636 RepID=A0A2M7VA32_9BACT|nr:MAG: hypothetical protein COX80_03435 [Candidatus Magasanikbacteria bacterium CG_4_10_14_0_2_um_filter_33_14]